MFVVVSYDIPSDRTRTRVSKTLSGFGNRRQYSVFECEVSEARLRELKKKIDALIDRETDSVIFYRLCGSCRCEIEIFGRGDLPEVLSLIVV